MKFTPTPLKDAYVIDLEKRGDDRGFFARFFCRDEFREQGLKEQFVQVNNSFSKDKGTLRGMHYQLAPHCETKVVRCLTGALYDVIIDLRPESPTFKQHFGVELTAENRTMLYVPDGFAHGFLTLKEDTESLYLVTEFFAPEAERAIRWNDPTFGIEWPATPEIVSNKDQNHPDFDPSYHLADLAVC
jgi:dTDP-4-dehydrorhamnose 3,5-epimerase